MKHRVPVFLAGLGLAAMAIPFTAGLVSAHSGSVAADQTCDTWSAYVYLANNVTSDRTVEVLTTIPGTTGLTNYHIDTTSSSGDTAIWDATGPAPTTGTVTLNIYNGNNLEFTQSKSLPAPTNCLPTEPPTTPPTEPPTTPPTESPTSFQSFQGQTATPTVAPTGCDVVVGDAFVTPTPCESPTVEPTGTPFQSIQGETGTPGQTATPPSTSTSGDGSGNSSTPLGALLISLALGGLGLAAVELQRRSVRR